MEKLKHQDFNMIYGLMEKSFPSDEYRSFEQQKELLKNPAYSVRALYDGSGAIKAFIALWEFDEFVFIEHFAVDPECRGEGIGGKMLNELTGRLDKIVCLEAELPESEMAGRRIDFYKRNKFFLNEYPYVQPPMSKEKNAVPLLIMTSDGKVNRQMFEQIKNVLYTRVYKKHK